MTEGHKSCEMDVCMCCKELQFSFTDTCEKDKSKVKGLFVVPYALPAEEKKKPKCELPVVDLSNECAKKFNEDTEGMVLHACTQVALEKGAFGAVSTFPVTDGKNVGGVVAVVEIGSADTLNDKAGKFAKVLIDLSKQYPHMSSITCALGQFASSLTPVAIKQISTSIHLATILDCRYKSEVKGKVFNACNVTIVGNFGCDVSDLSKAALVGKTIAAGIRVTRDLVVTPANLASTVTCAKTAVSVANQVGLKSVVLGPSECAEKKMGLYLAVNQGSKHPVQFVHLTYSPPSGKVTKRIALVGKGIVFDAGGYNIKTTMMELMKFDMGGGAAVIGAARIIGELKPENVEVHFIVPFAENMVSQDAYRPSDILTASNGKTVEITNTDAEGRLVLADALVYAEGLGVDEIVDIATLTGAGIVALGTKRGAVYSQDDTMAQRLISGAEEHCEKLWRMPLEEEYEDMLESSVADMVNSAESRWGGSIVAALFLKAFVANTKWAHIDMAGPVWDWKAKVATGFGAATLSQFVLDSVK